MRVFQACGFLSSRRCDDALGGDLTVSTGHGASRATPLTMLSKKEAGDPAGASTVRSCL